MMQRSARKIVQPLLLIIVFSAALIAAAQQPRIIRGRLAMHAFLSDIRQGHDPQFELRRGSGITPGDAQPEELSFWGYTLYGPGPGRLQVGDAYIFSKTVGADSIGIYRMPLDPSGSSMVMGRMQHLQVAGFKADGSDSLFGDVYMPQQLLVLNDWPPAPDPRSPDLRSIGSDTVLRWSADPQNDKGVYISVHCRSASPGNEAIYNGNFLDIANCIWVPDNGQAVLPRALFKGIPRGAVVSLMVLRANHSYLRTATGTVTKVPFIGMTWCMGDFRYAK